MFGQSSLEGVRPPKKFTPEEVLAAQKAADAAIREKSEKLMKEKAEHEETLRLGRLMQAEQARTAAPHEITEQDLKEAEKAVGQNFERLN